jgi:hypothetical protein
MLVTVKSREIQRGLLAEARGDRLAASRHLLAAAHLEVVLADDYERQGEGDLAFRSRLSAASCFWRAGEIEAANQILEDLRGSYPERHAEIDQVLTELR